LPSKRPDFERADIHKADFAGAELDLDLAQMVIHVLHVYLVRPDLKGYPDGPQLRPVELAAILPVDIEQRTLPL
jgi:hypothetical protein